MPIALNGAGGRGARGLREQGWRRPVSGGGGEELHGVTHGRPRTFAVASRVVGTAEAEPGTPVIGSGLGFGPVLFEFSVRRGPDDPAARRARKLIDGQPAFGFQDLGHL